MRFIDVRLRATSDRAAALHACYVDGLGFEVVDTTQDDLVGVRVGETALRFASATAGDHPFYHFAALVPGDRFDASHSWLSGRVELQKDPETGDDVFDFANWNALACYFLDPCGNIVELIAHRGLPRAGDRDASTP